MLAVVKIDREESTRGAESERSSLRGSLPNRAGLDLNTIGCIENAGATEVHPSHYPQA